ncbi:MAG TPA: glycosyltransferase [Vicinamibacterales bacterium]|nr:glycosyltransferase [Vicinamibacterales bacterium]
MSASARPLIVCLSNTDWGFLRYRKQHLMERLSQHVDVVYVNPPRALKAREWPFRTRTRQLSPSLWVHEPFVMPGIRRFGLAKWITYGWIARRLAAWRSNRPVVLWLYSPHGLPFVDLLQPDRVVYDIADLHATPSGRHLRDDGERREIEALAELEKTLLARADLTLCVSEPLVEWVGDRSRRVALVPNGCDWPRYADARPTTRKPGSFRVGYVGTLAPRFDIELVAAIATARPNWIVELVGPTLPLVDVSPLTSLRNVMLSGEVPFDNVPAKLASFDVCLLPLREIDFSYHCSPIQVFDYLAAGKPVVSTPIGQLQGWPPGLIHVARGAQEFVAAIETGLGERTAEHVDRRRMFAARNTWDVRVAQIAEALGDIGIDIHSQSRAYRAHAEAWALRRPLLARSAEALDSANDMDAAA